MSEELKSTLKYLKNKNNTRRIKAITITEAQKVVEEIERLTNIINKAIEYIEESCNETVEGIEGIAKFFSKRNETLLKILKEGYKE